MAVTAVLEQKSPEEKFVLVGVERRRYFRERLLERIREEIGTNNKDQEIREQILVDICAKITAVYVGCFEKVEHFLGKEVWAYRMGPEEFHAMPKEKQERCKDLSLIWNGECKDAIKLLGNNIISDVIYILSQVEFTPVYGVDILAQARLREQKRLEVSNQQQKKENEL